LTNHTVFIMVQEDGEPKSRKVLKLPQIVGIIKIFDIPNKITTPQELFEEVKYAIGHYEIVWVNIGNEDD